MISILLTVYIVVTLLILASLQSMGPPRFWGWVAILFWPVSAVFLICHAVVEGINR